MIHPGRLAVRHAACSVMPSAPPIARRRAILEAVYCKKDFQRLRVCSKVYPAFFQKLRHMWPSRRKVFACHPEHLCLTSTHVCHPTQVCVNTWRYDGDDWTACMTTRPWQTISAQAILILFMHFKCVPLTHPLLTHFTDITGESSTPYPPTPSGKGYHLHGHSCAAPPARLRPPAPLQTTPPQAVLLWPQ